MRGETISETMYHDAGAMVQCSFCGRYSDNYKALVRDDYVCDCGETKGWSGSFKRPTEQSLWSGEAGKDGDLQE